MFGFNNAKKYKEMDPKRMGELYINQFRLLDEKTKKLFMDICLVYIANQSIENFTTTVEHKRVFLHYKDIFDKLNREEQEDVIGALMDTEILLEKVVIYDSHHQKIG